LRIATGVLGLVMAFGAGVLISAVAYELVQEAFETSAGSGGVALGFALGSLAFFTGDLVIDRMGGAGRKRSGRSEAGGKALAIVLGIVLDGIPESIVLGDPHRRGGQRGDARRGVSLQSAGIDRRDGGTESRRLVPRASDGPVGPGDGRVRRRRPARLRPARRASQRTIAFVLAFAGGAIPTMLADTMMPEAFEHSGRYVGLATATGFGLAFAITALE
jgi:ZIP family zinc transporter